MTGTAGILDGIRVIDLTRLAPGPYGTMLLADLGAEVIVVGGGPAGLPIDAYRRGKRFMRLDLKSDAGRAAFLRLVETADVLVEGFRPGVCDRLGIGFEALSAVNGRLVYCSLTGYGQDGPMAQEAGHDLNYVSLAGMTGAFAPPDAAPFVPLNLLADFAGGGLYAAYSVLAALFERQRSGQGQHIDIAMVDGCISFMAMHFPDWGRAVLPSRGRGLLTGEAPFYRCHTCADGRHVAVGALETPFFRNLWAALGYADEPPDHMNPASWPELTRRFEQTFRERTRDDWAAHCAGRDACVSPVLAPDEVFGHPHNRARWSEGAADNVPAIPRFSRVAARPGAVDVEDRSTEILASLGLTDAEIDAAVPEDGGPIRGLDWPPIRD